LYSFLKAEFVQADFMGDSNYQGESVGEDGKIQFEAPGREL
jgi:hypothetical protein